MRNIAYILLFSFAAICCVVLTTVSNDALLDICLLTSSIIFIILTVSAVINIIEQDTNKEKV